MGHTRLGALPKTRNWIEVVSYLSSSKVEGEEFRFQVDEIAERTLRAAEGGLARAEYDLGLRFTFFLLAQIALASRDRQWIPILHRMGIELPPEGSLLELTVAIHKAIDEYVSRHSRPTDISEIAQQAAGEAIAELAGPNVQALFGTGSEELRLAVRGMSTKKGFGELGQRFFGRFLFRYLNFYLSRATPTHVGSTFRDIHDVTTFNNLLSLHCEQSARIVKDYCGEWYSKTEYKRGITIDRASEFIPRAIRKLRSELKLQQEGS